MTECARIATALAMVLAIATSPAAAAEPGTALPCPRCVVAELTLDQVVTLASTEQGRVLRGAQVLVRVGQWSDAPRDAFRRLADRGVSVIIESRQIEVRPDDEVARSVAGIVFDTTGTTTSADELAFTIKQHALAVRSRTSGVRVGVEATDRLIQELSAHSIAPYVDVLIPSDNVSAVRAGFSVWIRDSARTGLAAITAPAAMRAERVIRPLSPNYVLTLGALGDLLPSKLAPLDRLIAHCEPACDASVFLNPDTLDAVATVTASSAPRRIWFDPPAADARIVAVSDAGDFIDVALADLEHSVDLPASVLVVVRDWGAREGGQFATDVDVRAPRRLRVEEIIAKHQQARVRQQQVLRSLIAHGHSLLTFEAPGFVAPVTVTADTVLYARGGLLEVEQRDIRVNGMAIGTRSRVPKLPLIEPERIATPPLTLTLGEQYRYRLSGEETIAGQLCYLVAFSSQSATNVAGRVWISAHDFSLVRISFVQRSARGPIVSSEQRDDFVSRLEHGTVVSLPLRTEIHQMYEGPVHRTPIHRVVEFSTLVVNAPDFEDRLAEARRGLAVMLRDTPQGFRYLERDSDATPGGVREVPLSRSQRVRTIAFGVIVDPNITRPLPYAGVNYLDFNLFGTGTQLNAFGGAGFGRASFTTPPLLGSRWQLMGDGSAIAASYNDRVFVDGRERHELNLRQRPVQATIGVMGPLARSLRVRGEYHADYTRLERSDATAAAFSVPVSPFVHSARVALEAQRGAWTGGVWWSAAVRQRWTAWGNGSSGADSGEAERTRAFQRYGASLARSFILSRSTVSRVDIAWMGGHDLDRFSRYTFGTFDNRLHGYPAASIRYDKGVVAHSVAAWTPAPRIRLDGFFDIAVVREAGFARRSRSYPGVGIAVEAPMPLGFLTAAEWGYGVRGFTSSGGRGTHVFRLSAYKMF